MHRVEQTRSTSEHLNRTAKKPTPMQVLFCPLKSIQSLSHLLPIHRLSVLTSVWRNPCRSGFLWVLTQYGPSRPVHVGATHCPIQFQSMAHRSNIPYLIYQFIIQPMSIWVVHTVPMVDECRLWYIHMWVRWHFPWVCLREAWLYNKAFFFSSLRQYT